MGELDVRRLAADLYWVKIGQAEEIYHLYEEAKASPFKLDRTEDLPGEDFKLDQNHLLFGLSAPVVDRCRAAMTLIASPSTLRFQTPYVIRYRPCVRSTVEVHIDHSAWTCVLYLNTLSRGGELEFPSLGISLRPRAGFAAIFPGGPLYPHTSRPLHVMEKYALVLMADWEARARFDHRPLVGTAVHQAAIDSLSGSILDCSV